MGSVVSLWSASAADLLLLHAIRLSALLGRSREPYFALLNTMMGYAMARRGFLIPYNAALDVVHMCVVHEYAWFLIGLWCVVWADICEAPWRCTHLWRSNRHWL